MKPDRMCSRDPKYRLLIYNEMLKRMSPVFYLGLCDILKTTVFNIGSEDYYGNFLMCFYPELKNQRPDSAKTLWWPLTEYGYRKRRKAINNAIIEVKKTIATYE